MRTTYFEDSFSTVTISREADNALIGKYHSPSMSNNTALRRHLITVLRRIVYEKKVFFRHRGNYKRRGVSERRVYLKSRTFRLKRDYFKKEQVLGCEIHPDYHFDKICFDFGLTPFHVANLLLLVSNILTFDVGAHFDFKAEEIDDYRIQAQDFAIQSFLRNIEELAKLKREQEVGYIGSIKVKSSIGSFELVYNSEYQQVIEILIENRIKEITESSFDLLFDIKGIENWSSEDLQNYTADLKKRATGKRFESVISRTVSLNLLEYLKGEKLLMSEQGGDMSQKQGVIIYTFLLVFNLLKQTEALKERTDADKAKYIYSIIDKYRNKRGYQITRQLDWEEVSIERYLLDNQSPQL